VDLTALSQFAQAHDADWCFSLFRFQEEGRYMGMDLQSDGRIRALVAGTNGPRLANGGVYLVHPRALAAVEQGRAASLENDLFPAFLGHGQVFSGLECPGRFIDIGVPADYQRAAEVLPPFTPEGNDHD
jgi:D-glycero-alpha-D-manno-heptose 1-phosphate guanylyltransferase